MQIPDIINRHLWKLLIGWHQCISALIILTIALFVILLLLKVVSKYLWKIILRLYSFILYFTFGKILYVLLKLNSKPPLFRWDDTFYYHLFNIDELLKNSKSVMVNKLYTTLRKLSLIIFWILVLLILPNFMNKEQPYIISLPIKMYSNAEEFFIQRYGLEERAVVIVEEPEDTSESEEDTIATTEEVKIYYGLNKLGKDGANIREKPDINSNTKIVTSISGDKRLEYLDETSQDSRGTTWIKVMTEDGITGWISRKLVELVD